MPVDWRCVASKPWTTSKLHFYGFPIASTIIMSQDIPFQYLYLQNYLDSLGNYHTSNQVATPHCGEFPIVHLQGSTQLELQTQEDWPELFAHASFASHTDCR